MAPAAPTNTMVQSTADNLRGLIETMGYGQEHGMGTMWQYTAVRLAKDF
jgi:hypothetical protein